MPNNDLMTTWLHKSFPYIQPVSINANSTNSEMVLILNNALENPNLELLDKKIVDIEQLLRCVKLSKDNVLFFSAPRVIRTKIEIQNPEYGPEFIFYKLNDQLEYLKNL